MTTHINMTRRSAVGLRLGATAASTINIPSRGNLDATILQISTRMPGGGVWTFQGNGSVSGTVIQRGSIAAAGMVGGYSVLSSGAGTFLLVSLGNRQYLFKARRRVSLYLTPRGAASSATKSIRGIGAYNPNFVAPSANDVSNNPPGQALSDAAVALLAHFSSNGVPSEHVSDPTVEAFQVSWNNDPLSRVNANGLLSTDGGFGPNTHDALAAIAGAANVPAINTAPAPAGAPTVAPSSTTTTTTTTTTSIMAGMPTWAYWVVGAAAVGGAYVVGKAAYKKHGGRVMGHARRLHGRLRHHARRLTHRPA